MSSSIGRARLASSVAASVLVLLALVLTGCNPLSSSELKREVDSIGAAAAEGQLLASDVSLDRTKATFVRVHAGELASSADESAEKINDADVANGLEDEAKQAIKIAMDTSDALGELEIAPGDEQGARDVEAKLERASKAADMLSAKL
jgi:hypothetical protein